MIKKSILGLSLVLFSVNREPIVALTEDSPPADALYLPEEDTKLMIEEDMDDQPGRAHSVAVGAEISPMLFDSAFKMAEENDDAMKIFMLLHEGTAEEGFSLFSLIEEPNSRQPNTVSSTSYRDKITAAEKSQTEKLNSLKATKVAALLCPSAKKPSATNQKLTLQKKHSKVKNNESAQKAASADPLKKQRRELSSEAKKAAFEGDIKKIKFLVEQQKLRGVDNQGNTAARAAKGSQLKVIECLFNYHINLLKTNDRGETIGHIAAYQGDLKLLGYYLSLSVANREAQDKYGNTLLLKAARQGQNNCIAYLIQKGANTKAKDNHGKDREALYKQFLTELKTSKKKHVLDT